MSNFIDSCNKFLGTRTNKYKPQLIILSDKITPETVSNLDMFCLKFLNSLLENINLGLQDS